MARAVGRPRKRQPKPGAGGSGVPPHAIEFTRTEKVFYPKARFTKGDLIKYYLEIAPASSSLRRAAGHAQAVPRWDSWAVLLRERRPGYTPAWVPTFPVPRREGGEPIHYILIDDARVLAWCANGDAVDLLSRKGNSLASDFPSVAAGSPKSKKSHFGEGVTPEQMKELKWAKPKLVAQISFAEWTTGGNLRHATFLGLREDKDARQIVRELSATLPQEVGS